jgi:hypothetical protein
MTADQALALVRGILVPGLHFCINAELTFEFEGAFTGYADMQT